ncbi:MAG: tetratricopeptide repeat protein [Leptospiraceae bacterium]|nr:tetratricopeptide repeat protein [Leptospiraceae bacterium]
MKKGLLIIAGIALASLPLLSRPGETPEYSSSVELYRQAEEFYNQGKYRQSLQMLREALEKNPSFSKAHLLSGLASIEISDYERAIVHLDQVLRADPHNLDARIGKGRALTGLGRLQQAEMLFQEVKEKDPGNVDNLYGLAQLRILSGRYDLARQYLGLILRKDPAHRQALQDMAILETREGRLESGRDYLKKATAVDPAHNTVSVTRGIVLSLQADHANSEAERLALKDEAADAFRTAARENPGRELLQRIIQLDIERGYPEDGLDILQQARESYDGSRLLLLAANLSHALYNKTGERKYLDQTMEDLKRLCLESPEDVLACYRLEILSLENPGTAELRSMLAGRHLQLARSYESDLRYGLLVSHLKEALQLSPGNAEIENRLLEFYRSEGDFNAYLQTLVNLRDQNPDEPLWQYRVERALQSRKQYLSYREGLQQYANGDIRTRRPTVVLVMDFESLDPSHWNEEQIVSHALEDAINDISKLQPASRELKSRIREMRSAEEMRQDADIETRLQADYRPLLFEARDFEYLDELDRKMDSRLRIRYILSGSFRSFPGGLEISYTLRDRFTGKEILNQTSRASGEDALHVVTNRIASSIAKISPVRGEIVKIANDRIYVHAGATDGIKKDQVFMLDSDPGRLFRVVEVDTAFAALKPEGRGTLLSPGMVLVSNPRRP